MVKVLNSEVRIVMSFLQSHFPLGLYTSTYGVLSDLVCCVMPENFFLDIIGVESRTLVTGVTSRWVRPFGTLTKKRSKSSRKFEGRAQSNMMICAPCRCRKNPLFVPLMFFAIASSRPRQGSWLPFHDLESAMLFESRGYLVFETESCFISGPH